MVAERLFVHGNVYVGDRGYPTFSVVRYGNVLGSRGSVVPTFLEQRHTGTLTITDARMTRFWMTLDDACWLVSHALEHRDGGIIYVPADLPAMPILNLARIIAPMARLMFTGIRPGEKLHESLISPHEIPRTYRVGTTYAILPEPSPLGQGLDMTRVPNDFVYSSETARSLSVEEVVSMIGELPEGVEWRKEYDDQVL
jgi:UDP-N-acetylglucosamine 4,6-dehydratase